MSLLMLLWAVSCIVLLGEASAGGCPFAGADRALQAVDTSTTKSFDAKAFEAIDFDAVKADIRARLTNSEAFWPADFGNYGPFFIRLAWHCAGTYRKFDGRGGCDGARQRFEPERSWEDNTNLDKARTLLQPIKLKYGPGLSWGDLIILAGTTAIESMGGTVLGFCGGRVDDVDGTDSLELGLTEEQEAIAPCPVNGNCSAPLGPTTVGLIYVNPEGPMGQPIPDQSALQSRDTFSRMGMDDVETVALIGGGHAFGKVHGACPTGAGPSPKEDPANPWPGTCGTGANKGKGNNTYTSGLEGSWVDTPTQWSNDYFTNLLEYDWEVHVGPGGKHQWRPINKTSAGGPVSPIMMLTSDIGLIKDPTYLQLVQLYAKNRTMLDDMFAKTWYKLVTRDMGPVTRCLGKDVPPAQPFQNPLPPPPQTQADFARVRSSIKDALTKQSAALQPDVVGGKPYYGALFATLAWQCASTFRATDYLGGCNGARIRFSPEKDWPMNVDMDKVLQVLEPIKAQYGAGLTYADLIVLAGQTAIEEASNQTLKFCPGRSDALDGSGSETLAPRTYYPNAIVEAVDNAKVMGLSRREYVALAARPRSPVQQRKLGYSGSWTENPSQLSNEYFQVLLTENWQEQRAPGGKMEYMAAGKGLYMMPSDLALKFDAEYLAVAQEYASDAMVFTSEFASAWTKMMNADRFAGPAENLCDA